MQNINQMSNADLLRLSESEQMHALEKASEERADEIDDNTFLQLSGWGQNRAIEHMSKKRFEAIKNFFTQLKMQGQREVIRRMPTAEVDAINNNDLLQLRRVQEKIVEKMSPARADLIDNVTFRKLDKYAQGCAIKKMSIERLAQIRDDKEIFDHLYPYNQKLILSRLGVPEKTEDKMPSMEEEESPEKESK